MITILDQNFSQLNTFIADTCPSRILILADENTHEYCLPTLLGNLETDIPFEIIEIEAGEEMKTLDPAAQLWEILTEFETDRKALLINLGGGVITDLGGFIASTYKRGIPFINIPTTLLGMCDASIGGKTGIDHLFLKNMIGTFASPKQIFVYPDFLKTLPFEELRSGFAEMLKHGLIADEAHWKDLISINKLSPETIAPFIERSMQIKQQIIEKDYREENLRKTLNFGHTIGHAVESLFLKNTGAIKHGEAVAMGMICEVHVSLMKDMLSDTVASEITGQLNRFFPLLDISRFSMDEILDLIRNDKKNSSGDINFSLLSAVGKCEYDCGTSENDIITAIRYYLNIRNVT